MACTALVRRPLTEAEAVPFMEETMDDLKKKGADDRTKINMNEAWEVDFWTHELAVSKDELQKVIDKVGNSTAAVRRELGQLRTSR
jgi:hypothetical protein